MSLERNLAREKVQAQVGLPRRSLGRQPAGPADVVELPDELFELPHLSQVLSLETWNTCLSHSEREHLLTFLPEGSDLDEAITALLTGECVNFGNPLASWGKAVCNRTMHPDEIASHEARVRTERRHYLSALHAYHRTMIHNLQQLKDVWLACKTPEKIRSETERWARTRTPARLLPQEISSEKLDDVTDGIFSSQRLKKRKSLESQPEASDLAAQKKQVGATDIISGELNTIQVSKKQFAEIASRKQTGEEVRLDTLQEVLGGSKTWQKLLQKESFGDEVFKSCWRALARKDVPEVFKGFSQRASERRKMTAALATECMLKTENHVPQQPLSTFRLEEVPEQQAPNGSKLDLNVDSLLYYPKSTRTSDDDELASIQELWSYNYLQDDAPIHL